MSSIGPKQADVLRTLTARWPAGQIVLVGAAAASCFLELRRMTLDIDLTLSLSIESYEQELRALPGWQPHRSIECRWIAPGKVEVDIVPADRALRVQGYLVWPRSSRRMSLCGVRLAFAHAVVVEIEPNLPILVAPLHVLAVLKMVAYVERPGEREKDLGDIAVIMEGYVDDDRRFSDGVVDLGLSYPDVSPYLLGVDLARLVDDNEREAIERFLALTRDERGPNATLARMASMAPPEYRDPTQLTYRLEAFESGLGR